MYGFGRKRSGIVFDANNVPPSPQFNVHADFFIARLLCVKSVRFFGKSIHRTFISIFRAFYPILPSTLCTNQQIQRRRRTSIFFFFSFSHVFLTCFASNLTLFLLGKSGSHFSFPQLRRNSPFSSRSNLPQQDLQ